MEKQYDIKRMESIIEGLLFAAGDRVTLDRIATVLEHDKGTVRTVVSNMMYNYNNSSRGIMIREINGAYQLCTRPEIYDSIKVAFEPKNKQGLSQAAVETLSIIAYNGPVTKLKIEQIRGVSSDGSVTKLMDRGLVQDVGRMDTPGKPILYDVTHEFYRQFGFNSRADLPVLEMNEVMIAQEVTEE